jgi:hypothetical protein
VELAEHNIRGNKNFVNKNVNIEFSAHDEFLE